jgi:uncharacterized protein (UPF0332 family)
VTTQHRRLQIAAEIAKGEDALRAAESLLSLGLFDDAVTRFYYAAFHFAIAALVTEDVEVQSHRGLQSLFSQHLVRTRKLPPSCAKALKRLQGFREAADYDRHFRFDAAGAAEEADVARRLIDDLRRFLDAGGWIDPAAST